MSPEPAGRAPRRSWEEETRERTLITPEGVPLDFVIAPVGDRLIAFLIDNVIVFLVVFGLILLASLFHVEGIIALAILGMFLINNFYFMWFEHRWQGRTPGKRARHLRVVDADGGQLTVEAVLVRNLTRYLEVAVPSSVIAAPETVWPNAPSWSLALCALWLLILALMPLFNRERRRLGDLAAGTLVIRSPRPSLLRDLVDPDRAQLTAGDPGTPEFVFTEAQLRRYGIYELQVLEEVLRNPHSFGAEAGLQQIREKIQAKIGHEGYVADDRAFLEAFYGAQRAHLERRMLLGERREDKHAGEDPAGE